MMTEEHSGELLVSEYDWKNVPNYNLHNVIASISYQKTNFVGHGIIS